MDSLLAAGQFVEVGGKIGGQICETGIYISRYTQLVTEEKKKSKKFFFGKTKFNWNPGRKDCPFSLCMLSFVVAFISIMLQRIH